MPWHKSRTLAERQTRPWMLWGKARRRELRPLRSPPAAIMKVGWWGPSGEAATGVVSMVSIGAVTKHAVALRHDSEVSPLASRVSYRERVFDWLVHAKRSSGMAPGSAMIWHISIGTTILAAMIIRLGWRFAHPVTPESSLPADQRISSEAVHWLLYLLIIDDALWMDIRFRSGLES